MSTQQEEKSVDIVKAKGLLVKLIRHKFNHNRLDAKLSKQLVKDVKAQDKAAIRVNKTIIPKESLKPVTEVINELSKYFYGITVPWDDRGWRLLSIPNYKEFTKTVKKHTNRFSEAVTHFVDNVAGDLEKAQVALGDAFKWSDYSFIGDDGLVDQEALLKTFKLHVDYDTITDGSIDVRASLTDEERKFIEQSVEQRIEAQFAESQRHLFRRLYEVIEAIHERMSTADAIFRDSIVGNIKDLAQLLPKMNIAGDETLDLLAEKAEKELCRFDPQELRENPDARKDVAAEAEKILDGMKGMI